LLFVRHGQSTWNHEHRIQGQLDPPLSDEGRRQAALLGRRLAGRTFAGFYTSDLKRASETSALIGAEVGIPPVAMPEIREIYLGEWEGLRTDELATGFPQAWASWSEEPDWDVVPAERDLWRSRPASLQRWIRSSIGTTMVMCWWSRTAV
jgi:broad specificity phosphatase PhoE